jgi:glc operon protein GlcG
VNRHPILVALLTAVSMTACAQTPPGAAPPAVVAPTPLALQPWQQIAEGPAISLEAARRIGSAASRYARDNQFTVVIAITDVHGNLVYFERADSAMTGANQIALDKARTAARFKRSTKMLEDAVSAGGPGLRLLSVDGLLASEGGLPILVEGRIVGAIGVSGATNVQDGLIAAEGLRALR